MSRNPASKFHSLPPPPGLDHPAQENAEPLPAPLQEPPNPPGTREGVPPTHTKYRSAEHRRQAQYIGDRCKPRSSTGDPGVPLVSLWNYHRSTQHCATALPIPPSLPKKKNPVPGFSLWQSFAPRAALVSTGSQEVQPPGMLRYPRAGKDPRRHSPQECCSTPWQGEIPVDAAPRDALVSSGSPRLPRQGEAQASTAPLLACLPPPSQQPAGFLSADTGCCSSECAGPSSPSPAPGREEWPGCIRPGE